MARKIKFIGISKVDEYIKQNKDKIQKILKKPDELEYATIFGKNIYIMKIKSFIDNFKLYKKTSYALKIYNTLSSYETIKEIINRTSLKEFSTPKKDINTEKIQNLKLFYTFVYILDNDKSFFAQDIKEKLFVRYFIHYIYFVRNESGRKIDYQNMVKHLLKDKIADIEEKIYKKEEQVEFKLIFNNEEIFSENGKSIKTLRKKAYKKLFLHILENQQVLNTIRIR